MAEVRFAKDAETTQEIGRELAAKLTAGDMVLFRGELGAGKTTMIRGILEGFDYRGTVRSPTFNLIQTYSARVPVMHADLYRVGSAEGIGLEDYLSSHLCLIEWPERLNGLIDEEDAWQISLVPSEGGREITISSPLSKSASE